MRRITRTAGTTTATTSPITTTSPVPPAATLVPPSPSGTPAPTSAGIILCQRCGQPIGTVEDVVSGAVDAAEAKFAGGAAHATLPDGTRGCTGIPEADGASVLRAQCRQHNLGVVQAFYGIGSATRAWKLAMDGAPREALSPATVSAIPSPTVAPVVTPAPVSSTAPVPVAPIAPAVAPPVVKVVKTVKAESLDHVAPLSPVVAIARMAPPMMLPATTAFTDKRNTPTPVHDSVVAIDGAAFDAICAAPGASVYVTLNSVSYRRM